MQSQYLVSFLFNVERLFTNLPFEESIDLAAKYILEDIPSIKFIHTLHVTLMKLSAFLSVRPIPHYSSILLTPFITIHNGTGN